MTNVSQNITRGSLGTTEARFLARVGALSTFTLHDVRRALGRSPDAPVRQFLRRLVQKGWIRAVTRGRFVVIPLSSGEDRAPQLHEFLVAMELVAPAAIAYWSALSHHGMTEQVPRTVFVATNHPVRRPPRQALGYAFKIVALRPRKFFGTIRDWVDERPFFVTDREKTIVDGLDLPGYSGGVGTVARALSRDWSDLDEDKLRGYALRLGSSAVVKRLGYLMESMRLGDPERLRASARLASGFPALDPTLPRQGTLTRRWGILVNAKIAP